MSLSRRRFLVGGGVAGAAVLGAGSVPGVRRRLLGSPSSPHAIPSGPTGLVVSGSFRSSAMAAVVGWSIVYPDSPAPLPMMLHLHGRTGSHTDVRHLAPFLSDGVRHGLTPFAVVGVDGGDHSYYHRRANGTDPERMILAELLPMLSARGLGVDRFAVGGVSMGGYGALLLAETLGSRVLACVADSPAIFPRFQDSAAGAFDGAGDFAAHDVLAGASRLAAIPLRVTCGTSDPFLPGVRALLAKVPSASQELGPGAHNRAWWDHTAPAQLAFVGRHL
jgi:S-formylglutathione hydrolase FrmB